MHHRQASVHLTGHHPPFPPHVVTAHRVFAPKMKGKVEWCPAHPNDAALAVRLVQCYALLMSGTSVGGLSRLHRASWVSWA